MSALSLTTKVGVERQALDRRLVQRASPAAKKPAAPSVEQRTAVLVELIAAGKTSAIARRLLAANDTIAVQLKTIAALHAELQRYRAAEDRR